MNILYNFCHSELSYYLRNSPCSRTTSSLKAVLIKMLMSMKMGNSKKANIIGGIIYFDVGANSIALFMISEPPR